MNRTQANRLGVDIFDWEHEVNAWLVSRHESIHIHEIIPFSVGNDQRIMIVYEQIATSAVN